MDYYLSAGWWDEQGLLKYGNESFNRYNFDAKINAKANSWAKVAVLFKYNYGLEKFPWQADLGRGRIYDMMTKMKPTMPAKYPGTDIWTQESRIDEWATQRDNSYNSQMVLAPRFILEPIKGWVTNIEFNYTTSNNRQELTSKQWFSMQPNGEKLISVAKANTSFRPRLYTDTYLSPNLYSTYTKSINKHNFSAMVGYLLGIENFVFNEFIFFNTPYPDNIQIHELIMDKELYYQYINSYREPENHIRELLGLPNIGEGWVSETKLFYLIKEKFNNHRVLQHGKPIWLGKQHLDIYIPDLNIGIEYQGKQHTSPVDFFGGEGSFEENKKRDYRKKKLCLENGCVLYEVFPEDDFFIFVDKIYDLHGDVT